MKKEEELEEFEPDMDEDDEDSDSEDEPELQQPQARQPMRPAPAMVKKPMAITPKLPPMPAPKQQIKSMVRNEKPTYEREVKAAAVQEPEEEEQQPVEQEELEQPAEQQEITGQDLVVAIQNHEQRLATIEAALFRLRGAI